MPKVKLNAAFTIDNKRYEPGDQEIPENHLAIMKPLDTTGAVKFLDSQTPLVSDVPAADNKPKAKE